MLAAVSLTVLSASLQAEEETRTRGRTRVGAWQTAWSGGGDVSFVPAPSPLKLPPQCALAGFAGGGSSPLPAPLHPPCLGVREHGGSGRERPRRSSEGRVCSLRLSFPIWNSPSRLPHRSKAKEIGELIAFLPGGG